MSTYCLLPYVTHETHGKVRILRIEIETDRALKSLL